ncbi:hypothetical protein PR048_032929 [Dryococelus australis]|uniref:Uncharacterized protein n=1 Tax=Dryococelus australis TaxID=614101 RepID=A0ABQ9G3L7_9NEOP|nr:hypothetical protein PR048_032929 [Dryococelus australis]
MKFRIDAGDDILASRIVSCNKNAKRAEYFTIMADETTYIPVEEQLVICIRYYDTSIYEIQEKFFKFTHVDVTGENTLEKLNLDTSYCRGQAYDRGSNRSGNFKCAQAFVAIVQPLAFYSHCAYHKLSSVANFFPQKKDNTPLTRRVKTRWVEKKDTVLTFMDTLPCLPSAWENISHSYDGRESNAFSFLHSIQSS